MSCARLAAGFVAQILLITFLGVGAGHTQFCPPGSTQVQSGYVIECHCPDGSLAGYQGCGGQSAAPQPQQSLCPVETTYCPQVNLCCGAGQYCSHYGCTPIGA